MNRPITLAERLSAPLLWAIALANMFFLAAFVATLLALSGPASAEAVACTGEDLLKQMERDEPGKLDAVRRKAALTPNGKGRLWKIEKEGLEPSFLFGTMHMTDPRVTKLPAAALAAFQAADTLVIETTDLLDQSALLLVMAERPELAVFIDDTTLASLMSPQEAAAAKAALAERGIPMESVAKMKPWMLSAMVSMPACELARKAEGKPVLDMKLARDAQAAGKTVGGLETAIEQFEAMASLPMAFHIEGLVETLKLGDRIDDVIETMIAIYLRGDTGLFKPFFEAALPSGGELGYAEFEEKVIAARNASMAENAKQYLDNGGAFVAVGALHLPGELGLIERLRHAGYDVTRAD